MVKFRWLMLIGACGLACAFASHALAQGDQADQPAISAEAVAQWRARRFGMFIHWGPVSLTGHEIGWSRGRETPVEVYDNLYKEFNPTKFDADQWVDAAESAGMKYLVITTKHHDGFCLWPSKQTAFNIAHSPFGRDVLKELSAACRKQGIGFGTYYSVCDWHHPSFPLGSPGGRTKKPNPNLDRYVEYLRGQVTELIENYGPLTTMWFDVPQEVHAERGVPTVEMVRKLQPDIMINNRAYRGFKGDYSTPEQRIGGFNRDHPWETCMTICRQWAWKPNDNMKSLEQCVQTLLYTVGGDGNLLLNVGPMPDGRIEPRQVQRLKEMGEWVKDHSGGIYGTRGGPFKPGKWGAATCKGEKIYLFVMNWPKDGPLELPPIDMKITGAKRMGGGTVTITQTDEGITVDVPANQREEIATPIELTVNGKAFDIEPVAVPHESDSLAFGKKAAASNVFQKMKQYSPDMAIDDNPESRWATDGGTFAAWLEVDLGKPMKIGSVLIDEPGEYRRVQQFELQSLDGAAWKTFLTGKKIGPNWSKTFTPITAQRVRLNILKATEGPTIAEFQLFKADR